MEDKATEQQLPSITVFRYLLYLIPARQAQIFSFYIDNSPRDLRSAMPSLAFGDPDLSNSVVVVFLSSQDMTDLHRLTVTVSVMRLMEFAVGDS